MLKNEYISSQKMEDTIYSVLCTIRSTNKVFRLACSQVILLNHKIEISKAQYDRARAAGRLAFRYSNRLKLSTLERIRDLIYEFAVNKCDEIEVLQAKLRHLRGGVREPDEFEEGANFSRESDSEGTLSSSELEGVPSDDWFVSNKLQRNGIYLLFFASNNA